MPNDMTTREQQIVSDTVAGLYANHTAPYSSSKKGGWIGVDLDGTLAEYPGTFGVPHGLGPPILKMVVRVKTWLSEGLDVRVVTARAAGPFVNEHNVPIGEAAAIKVVEDWCEEHIGQKLPVTASKDYSMIELWDDRAVQVIPNTGERVDGRD